MRFGYWLRVLNKNLALDRDQLVEKRLVEQQLTYLIISMRQKLLAMPAKLYSRLGKEQFPREAAKRSSNKS
jgi:hypothetical protein